MTHKALKRCCDAQMVWDIRAATGSLVEAPETRTRNSLFQWQRSSARLGRCEEPWNDSPSLRNAAHLAILVSIHWLKMMKRLVCIGNGHSGSLLDYLIPVQLGLAGLASWHYWGNFSMPDTSASAWGCKWPCISVTATISLHLGGWQAFNTAITVWQSHHIAGLHSCRPFFGLSRHKDFKRQSCRVVLRCFGNAVRTCINKWINE